MKVSEKAPLVLSAALRRSIEWQTQFNAVEWIVAWCAARVPLFDYPGLEEYEFPSGAVALADLERRVSAAFEEIAPVPTATATVEMLEKLEAGMINGTWLCQPYSGEEDPRHEALLKAGVL